MTGLIVKICGLSTAETLDASLAAGADMIGLVFFPKSPRHVSLGQAEALADRARGRAEVVALTVDADDTALEQIVRHVAPDRLQLHGRETPVRAADIGRRFGVPVMKAIGLAGVEDVAAAAAFRAQGATILFDAKAPNHAALPGGNGVPFDWSLLQDATGPFMLSGGLSPRNVASALGLSRATAVDVSSGVETAPGLKDPRLIADFVEAARSSFNRQQACLPNASAPAS